MFSAREVKSLGEKEFQLACTTEDQKQIWPFLEHKMPLRVCDYILHFPPCLEANFKLQITVFLS